MNIQTVAVGDLFQDNDRRSPSPRVVRVVKFSPGHQKVLVRNEEHWDEALIGRSTWISRDRLETGKNRQTGYTKVSR